MNLKAREVIVSEERDTIGKGLLFKCGVRQESCPLRAEVFITEGDKTRVPL